MKPASTGQKTDFIETGDFQIDMLPCLRTGVQTHQFCNYDRAGDNCDAYSFQRVSRE